MIGVIFDCDGVLVDSEPIAEEVWTDVLADLGYRVATGDFDHCLGRSRADVYDYFAERTKLPEPAVVGSMVDQRMLPAYGAGLVAFDDAVDTVRTLAKRGVPLAVASSSTRLNLDFKLAHVGLDRYFDVTIAGDEVRRGKPAPDLFLEAASLLGLKAPECLVIEDAPAGAAAADAAGMRVVVVARNGAPMPGRRSVDRLEAAPILSLLGL